MNLLSQLPFWFFISICVLLIDENFSYSFLATSRWASLSWLACMIWKLRMQAKIGRWPAGLQWAYTITGGWLPLILGCDSKIYLDYHYYQYATLLFQIRGLVKSVTELYLIVHVLYVTEKYWLFVSDAIIICFSEMNLTNMKHSVFCSLYEVRA